MPFIGTHIIIYLREPIVRDADPVRCLPALVADLGVTGLWAAQTEALLDIRVMHGVIY